MTWMDIVSHLVTALVSGGGAAGVLKWLQRSRGVDSAERLTRVSMDWTESVLARVRELEADAREMRRQLEEVQHELRKEVRLREEAQAELAGLRATIEAEQRERELPRVLR